jgi:hypothetical protein
MRSRSKLAAAVLIVLSAAGAGAQAAVPRARIVEDLRLDATKEDFPVVGPVYVGPHKQIIVMLPREAQLRWYDSTGKLIASVGRKGRGPGEFQNTQPAGWVGDTLWVYDGPQRRITFVGPNARVLRTTVLPQNVMLVAKPGSDPLRVLAFVPIGVYADGSMVGTATIVIREPSRGQRVLWYYARLAPSGAATLINVPPADDDPRWSIYIGGALEPEPVPFRLWPRTAESWDGSRFGSLISEATTSTGGTYTVAVMHAKGDTVFARSYPFTGTPIPARSIDSALARFLKQGKGIDDGAGARRSYGPELQAEVRKKVPKVYIPAQSITLGMDNTVWITMRDTGEGRVTLVLNSRGDPIASVPLPRNASLRQASISQIWAAETDADGLTSIVRYKVTGITCGAACR